MGWMTKVIMIQFLAEAGIFLFSEAFRPAAGYARHVFNRYWSVFLGIKWLRDVADHSSSCTSKVEDA
jgi:hypothetical protein